MGTPKRTIQIHDAELNEVSVQAYEVILSQERGAVGVIIASNEYGYVAFWPAVYDGESKFCTTLEEAVDFIRWRTEAAQQQAHEEKLPEG